MKNGISGARLSALSCASVSAISAISALSAASLLIGAPSPALAASTASPSLSEVVVLGSRFEESSSNVPATVQVITAQALRDSGVLSVPDALRMLLGANIRSSTGGQLGQGASIDLGGFGVTATQNNLVLVDGRRLNPIDSSEIDWGGIPLNSIQRIEVTTGGAGVEYGAGATGGVINIITNGKVSDRTLAQLSVGSFGTSIANFNLDRKLEDAFINLNAEASHSDGWRENSSSDAQSLNSKYSRNIGGNASAFVELFASQNTNGLSGGVVGQAGEGNQQAAKFNNVGAHNDTSKSGVRLGGLSELSSSATLEADLVYSTKASKFRQPYYDTPDSFGAPSIYGAGYVTGAGQMNMDGTEIAFSPRVRMSLAHGVTLVAGYDLSQANQDASNEYGPLAQQYILANQFNPAFPLLGGYRNNVVSDRQSVQLMNQSVYAVSRIPLVAQWELSLGARRQLQRFDSADLNKSSGSVATSGSFGANAHEAALNYKFNAASHAFLRIDQSYRFATTDEYWGFDYNMNRVFSGELRPQITKAYALGFESNSGSQQIAVSFGQSVTQDEIRYSPTLYRNSNLDDNIFRTSLNFNWSAQALENSRVSVGARFQRAEYLTGIYSGQTLPLVPNAIYNFGWVQTLNAQSKLGLQMVHVANQNYDADPGTVPSLVQLPAYTVADMFWSWTSGKVETRVTVKNLAGTNYAPYGGYSFISLPGGANDYRYYYYPSDPRSVYLSLNYQF